MSFIEPDPYEAYRLWKALFEGDPPVPSTEYRAMAIHAGSSGLPQDVFVNTFYFVADADKTVGPGHINDALGTFYDGQAGQTHSIHYYLSSFVVAAWQVKCYKMSDPHSVGPPKVQREPITFNNTMTSPRASGGVLPEEAAVCLSFGAAPPHTARRRGRIYIGPLAALACTTNAVGGSKPSDVLRTDFGIAAHQLDNQAAAGWIIRSSAGTESYAAVDYGWVDDAFDTQRRRGPDASTRTMWTKA
jgi:hypothetical protein